MSYSQLFEHDQQFMRLVRRETDVDLVTAALEIARDGQSDLMFEPTRVRLQRSVFWPEREATSRSLSAYSFM